MRVCKVVNVCTISYRVPTHLQNYTIGDIANRYPNPDSYIEYPLNCVI